MTDSAGGSHGAERRWQWVAGERGWLRLRGGGGRGGAGSGLRERSTVGGEAVMRHRGLVEEVSTRAWSGDAQAKAVRAESTGSGLAGGGWVGGEHERLDLMEVEGVRSSGERCRVCRWSASTRGGRRRLEDRISSSSAARGDQAAATRAGCSWEPPPAVAWLLVEDEEEERTGKELEVAGLARGDVVGGRRSWGGVASDLRRHEMQR